MNRRGILGLIGLGAVAPSIVSQNALGAQGSNVYPTPYTPYDFGKQAVLSGELNPVEQLLHCQKEYASITGNKDAWIADFITNEYNDYLGGYSAHRIETIDPDIRNMKSLSESAKIRMYLARRAQRKYDQSQNSLLRRIQELMAIG
jgi:hypothetical protein